MMNRFMECISKTFGQEAVMKLVLHDYGEGEAILHPMKRGDGDMVGEMIAYLEDEKMEEVSKKIRKKLYVIVQIYLQYFGKL